ncbi:MAG TPA: MlaD family protein [Myxococcota bacterium]|nr:MlaD family protein [Myxococcota bacterium]
MEAKVNFAIVGAFVLVLGAALIAGVLWLSSGGAYRKNYETYLAFMTESVSGLSLDAPVRYHGVEVGRVRRIALAPQDVEQVQLTLEIEQGTPVKVDTIAVLRVQGLTGIAFVELTGGSRDSPPLVAEAGEEYPVIRTGPSLMVRLDAAVTALLTSVTRTSDSLNALLDDNNRRALKQALANLEVVSRTLAARSAAIDSSLANAARTMENTAQLTAELSQLVARVQRSADAFDRMAGEITHAGAAAHAGAQQFSSETLPQLQQLVGELRELTASLRRLSNDLERNPAMLIHGRPAGKRGPGE